MTEKDFETAIRGISFEGMDDDKGSERRIRILVALGIRDKLTFSEIEDIIKHSAGAISPDLKRLEKKGLIKTKRKFLPNGKRLTTCKITEKGKQNVKEFLDSIVSCVEFLEKQEETKNI